jgi:hypothetical protein
VVEKVESDELMLGMILENFDEQGVEKVGSEPWFALKSEYVG